MNVGQHCAFPTPEIDKPYFEAFLERKKIICIQKKIALVLLQKENKTEQLQKKLRAGFGFGLRLGFPTMAPKRGEV